MVEEHATQGWTCQAKTNRQKQPVIHNECYYTVYYYTAYDKAQGGLISNSSSIQAETAWLRQNASHNKLCREHNFFINTYPQKFKYTVCELTNIKIIFWTGAHLLHKVSLCWTSRHAINPNTHHTCKQHFVSEHFVTGVKFVLLFLILRSKKCFKLTYGKATFWISVVSCLVYLWMCMQILYTF